MTNHFSSQLFRLLGLLSAALLALTSCGFQETASQMIPSGKPQGVPVDRNIDESNQTRKSLDLRPFQKDNGEPFSIAVIDSDGLWRPYVKVFAGMVEGLQRIGWIYEDIELPDPEEVWLQKYLEQLNEQEYSKSVTLLPEHYVDLEWDETNADKPLFRKLLSEDSPADLVICLGTLGGQIISSRESIPVPVIADSISDPIATGIIQSNSNSGHRNLTVRVDPNRYKRQIRLFYDIVQFETLGMIYEDTVEGRSYAALEDVQTIADEKGFSIKSNTQVLGDSAETPEEAEKTYIQAVEDLAPAIDAIYLTEQKGLSENNIEKVMSILEKEGVPSFSMTGADMVQKGVLFGVSDSERISTGIYHAKNMVRIFRGKDPGELDQIFEHVPHIAINLEAAEAIGYDIPIDIIASSDEIYSKSREE